MSAEKQPRKDKLSRKDFLKITWATLGSLAVLEIGGLSLAYIQPRAVEGEFGGQINVGNVDDFPPGSVSHIPNGRFYLARLPDGGFLALYQRCTHLGCNVPWDQEQSAFICPCHNSQFTTHGDVVNPPAPRPLDLFPVSIQENQVIVDTARPIQRQHYEPSQVVYA